MPVERLGGRGAHVDWNRAALDRLGAGIMPKFDHFMVNILPFVKPWPEAKNKAAWRKAILAQDGHKCVACGSTENLEADHVMSQRNFPELALVLLNGRTLCRLCHRMSDNWGGRAARSGY